MKDIYSPLEIDEQWDQRAPMLEDHIAAEAPAQAPVEVAGGGELTSESVTVDQPVADAATPEVNETDDDAASKLEQSASSEGDTQLKPGETFVPGVDTLTDEQQADAGKHLENELAQPLVDERASTSTTLEPLAEQPAPAPAEQLQSRQEQQQGQQDEAQEPNVEVTAEPEEKGLNGEDMPVKATESEVKDKVDAANSDTPEKTDDEPTIEPNDDTSAQKDYASVISSAQEAVNAAKEAEAKAVAEEVSKLKNAIEDIDRDIASAEAEKADIQDRLKTYSDTKEMLQTTIKNLDPSYQPDADLPGLTDPGNRFSQVSIPGSGIPGELKKIPETTPSDTSKLEDSPSPVVLKAPPRTGHLREE